METQSDSIRPILETFLGNYLPELQVRQKWQREAENLQPGTVVMIVDHQLTRAQWPVGQVTKVFPREDGRIVLLK